MSDNPYHDHLDVCAQCRDHPFNLCAEGKRILEAFVGAGVTLPGSMGHPAVAPENIRADRLVPCSECGAAVGEQCVSSIPDTSHFARRVRRVQTKGILKSERPEQGPWLELAEESEASVARAEHYPEMPPMLDGETAAQYTDRLTGADRTDRRPYDHPRNRQCSIGYHGECTDPSGERCKCPCHRAGMLEAKS